MQLTSEIARFEGIILADTQDSSLFRNTVPSALQLIKDLDGRRFRRLQRYITWIVNCPLPYGGGEYHYPTRTCRLDFEKPAVEPDAVSAAFADENDLTRRGSSDSESVREQEAFGVD